MKLLTNHEAKYIVRRISGFTVSKDKGVSGVSKKILHYVFRVDPEQNVEGVGSSGVCTVNTTWTLYVEIPVAPSLDYDDTLFPSMQDRTIEISER